jgi:hypothetical protein
MVVKSLYCCPDTAAAWMVDMIYVRLVGLLQQLLLGSICGAGMGDGCARVGAILM